jgi:single-strand DNA-binding protein
MEIRVKGRVGSDPEIKFVTKDQLPLATFSIAYTPRSRKGGEWVDGETMWFKVALFGNKAEAVADTIKKGDEVLVLGSVKQSTFQGRDGSEKTALEITASEVALVPRLQKGAPRAQAGQPDAYDPGW